jgi:hypothetical protein
MKVFRLKVVRIESEIVYRLHHFFYQVCMKLADIHSEIFERGIKIIEEADE